MILSERSPLREKCPYSKFFWSVLSRIRTEYGEILHISLYSVRMRENRSRKTPNPDTLHAVQNFTKAVTAVLNLTYKVIETYNSKLHYFPGVKSLFCTKQPIDTVKVSSYL